MGIPGWCEWRGEFANHLEEREFRFQSHYNSLREIINRSRQLPTARAPIELLEALDDEDLPERQSPPAYFTAVVTLFENNARSIGGSSDCAKGVAMWWRSR